MDISLKILLKFLIKVLIAFSGRKFQRFAWCGSVMLLNRVMSMFCSWTIYFVFIACCANTFINMCTIILLLVSLLQPFNWDHPKVPNLVKQFNHNFFYKSSMYPVGIFCRTATIQDRKQINITCQAITRNHKTPNTYKHKHTRKLIRKWV